MSTTDETKPAGKSRRRKGKAERSKKAAASPSSLPESPAPAELPSQDRKQPPQPVQAESLKEVQLPPMEEPVVAVVAAPEPEPAVTPPLAEPVPTEPLAVAHALAAVEQDLAEPHPAAPPPAEPAPVSLQTIANAYRDYTRKSIEDFGSFVEQLSGVRSLDKAMTVQSEFVKRAYENSVAESQKIYELHNRLAKQTLDPFKGLGKMPTPPGKS